LQATLSFIGESAAGYLKTGEIPGRMARVRNAQAFAFLTKDKLPFVIHCSVPEKFWLGLLKAVGRMELAKDGRFKTRDARRKNYEELHAELSLIFATRSRKEWLKRLEEHDVPSGPLYNMAEVLADPQVIHLGLVHEVKHPKVGTFKFVGSPVNYSDLPKGSANPPPLLGEHTEAILMELGYSKAAVNKLKEQGVVKTC
jgi:formyl-CoA transferase